MMSRFTKLVLTVAMVGGGLMLGPAPAAAGLIVDTALLPTPLWRQFGSPQPVSVVPFSDKEETPPGYGLSDRLTIGVLGFPPRSLDIKEPPINIICCEPEHAVQFSILNARWVFPPSVTGIAFPLREPGEPVGDWIILYNTAFRRIRVFANAFMWSDPFVDPPDYPPPEMIDFLPPDVVAGLVIGPGIDQNPDGTFDIPNTNVTEVPEPSSLLLIGVGLSGLGLLRCWRLRGGDKQSGR